MNANQMHSHAITLGNLYADPHILITGQKNSIRNRIEARKLDQVGNDKRVDTFLLPVAVNEAEPHLDIIKMRECHLIGRQASAKWCAIIPIDSQQIAGWCLAERQRLEALNSFSSVKDGSVALQFFARDGDAPLREKVACIDKNSDPIHVMVLK